MIFGKIPVIQPDGTKKTLEFKDNDVLAVIKFNGPRSEFNDFANKVITQVTEIPYDSEKHDLKPPFDGAKMYVLGTVNGIVRNEIIFIKNLPDSAG